MKPIYADSASTARVQPAWLEKRHGFALELGERIVRLRRRRGWSRIDLARHLGVRRDRLAKWEFGKNPPPLELLSALARTLGVSIDELVTGKPPGQGLLTEEQCQGLALQLEAVRNLLQESRIAVSGSSGQQRSGSEAGKAVEDHEERIYDLLEELSEQREGELLHLLDCPGCQGFARKMLSPEPDEPGGEEARAPHRAGPAVLKRAV